MRNELEKEVKRLQGEISSLKTENKQLYEDKQDVERQFIEFKIKHDHIVTKLRGKIAELSFQKTLTHDGTGKLYPPQSANQGFRSPSPTKDRVVGNSGTKHQVPHQQQQSSHLMLSHNIISNLQSPPAPAALNIPSVVPPVTGAAGDEGFRGPTFSELMRR
jgi:ABC-type phosphate transport system auxiliary subunit